ncbi:hypothetical protein BJ875DRAFT_523875, partial [Amylocarpus encephaloides]
SIWIFFRLTILCTVFWSLILCLLFRYNITLFFLEKMQFNGLPPELRQLIWDACILPRTIRIQFAPDFDLCHNQPVRNSPILSVNKESRTLALRLYTPIYQCNPIFTRASRAKLEKTQRPCLYVNYKLDTFQILGSNISPNHPEPQLPKLFKNFPKFQHVKLLGDPDVFSEVIGTDNTLHHLPDLKSYSISPPSNHKQYCGPHWQPSPEVYNRVYVIGHPVSHEQDSNVPRTSFARYLRAQGIRLFVTDDDLAALEVTTCRLAITTDVLEAITAPQPDISLRARINDAVFKAAAILSWFSVLYDVTRLRRCDVQFGPNDIFVSVDERPVKAFELGPPAPRVLLIHANPSNCCAVHALRELFEINPQPDDAPLFASDERGEFTGAYLFEETTKRLRSAGIKNWERFDMFSFGGRFDNSPTWLMN